VLAPPAATMRLAMGCATSSSSLGAAQVLAPPAATVRLAVIRAVQARERRGEGEEEREKGGGVVSWRGETSGESSSTTQLP
jgi:hypothetical protein